MHAGECSSKPRPPISATFLSDNPRLRRSLQSAPLVIALSLQTAPRTSNNQHTHQEIQNQPRPSTRASTANLSLRVCFDLKLTTTPNRPLQVLDDLILWVMLHAPMRLTLQSPIRSRLVSLQMGSARATTRHKHSEGKGSER